MESRECIYPQRMLRIPDTYLTTLPAALNDLCEGNESYKSIAAYLRLLGKKKRGLYQAIHAFRSITPPRG